MLEHEYTMLGGVSRVKVGRYLALISSGISAAIVFAVLWAINVAQTFGLPASVPPSVMSLAGAGAVFIILNSLLNRYAWRWSGINGLLRVPDLSGTWACSGISLDAGSPQREWDGTITIVQSWDKIRVRLKTGTSGSNSKTAALIRDEADGWRLFYNYQNEPTIDQQELRPHRGFAEIVFDQELKSGNGEYFNGYGRYTYGTMSLKRA